jgi:hypothetical protein
MPRHDGAQGLTAAHRLAGADAGNDRLVRRAPPVGVVDAHHRPAGDHAGEHDHPVTGRQHGDSWGGGQVGSAVPGPVPVGGELERPGHDQLAGHGSAPREPREGSDGERAGRRGGAAGQCDEAQHQGAGAEQRTGGHALMLRPEESSGPCRRRPVDGRRRCGRRQRARGVGSAPAGAHERPSGTRMLSGATRPDGSTSRVLFPPIGGAVATSVPAQPGGWCRRTPGRAPAGARDNRNRAAWVARASREAAIWQSSA